MKLTKDIVLLLFVLMIDFLFIYHFFSSDIRLEFVMDYVYFAVVFGFFLVMTVYLFIFIIKNQFDFNWLIKKYYYPRTQYHKCLEKCQIHYPFMIGSHNCNRKCTHCKEYDVEKGWIKCNKIKEARGKIK